LRHEYQKEFDTSQSIREAILWKHFKRVAMNYERTTGVVKPVPDGYPNVSPWITTGNTGKLIEFLKEAFDAKEDESSRYLNEDGTIGHAEARIGDSVILMFDAKPEWPPMQSLLRLYVPDADSAYQRAIDAGAEPVTKMTTLFYGDRLGRVRDPFGNIWWVQSHIENVDEKRMSDAMNNAREKEALKYVEQTLEWELGKNVHHAHTL
jgi:PhnB protein